MDRAARVGLGVAVVATLGAAVAIAFAWHDVRSERRQFEMNERIIAKANAERAKANARREASLTPEQKEARRVAALDAAVATYKESERKRRAEFLPSARGGCLTALRRNLHDPDSAEFGLTSEWPTTTADDGRVTVLARVRAKNGFGAMRLSTFRCVVEPVGNDSLRVIALDELAR